MLKKWISVLSLVFISISVSQALADGIEYSRLNRSTIYAESLRLRASLMRMVELAEWASIGGLSEGQLSALSSEFEAIKREVDRVSTTEQALLTTASNRFKAESFSTQGLGLSSVSISTDPTPHGQALNRQVLDEVRSAISNLSVEAATAWRRIAIAGSPNRGNCAGGYAAADYAQVRKVLNEATALLTRNFDLLDPIVNGNLSIAGRTVANAEFDYLKEELELLGEKRRPSLLPRTQNFIRTLVDPIYLDINDKVISSPMNAEAREQANRARVAIAAAYETINICAGS